MAWNKWTCCSRMRCVKTSYVHGNMNCICIFKSCGLYVTGNLPGICCISTRNLLKCYLSSHKNLVKELLLLPCEHLYSQNILFANPFAETQKNHKNHQRNSYLLGPADLVSQHLGTCNEHPSTPFKLVFPHKIGGFTMGKPWENHGKMVV